MPELNVQASELERRILRVMLQQNRVGQVASLLFAVFAIYALQPYAVSPLLLYCWFGLLATLMAFRLRVIRRYTTRELDARHLRRGLRVFASGLFLTGLTWAALPWCIADPQPEATYFFAIIAIGIAAGATAALALKPALFLLFTLPQLGSLAAFLVTHPVPLGIPVALVMLVFYLGMFKAAGFLGRELRGSFVLQQQAVRQRSDVEGHAARLASVNASMQRRREMFEGMLRIATQGEMDSLQRMHRLLEFGCNALGLRVGMVTEIRNERLRVFASHDPLRQERDESDSGSSLCSLAMKSEEPFHFANTGEARRKLDPEYTGRVAGAYVGARIHNSEGLFGTLCFQDPSTRAASFTDAELDFVRLLAGWVGAELSEYFAQRRLRAKERQLSTLADAMPCGMAALDRRGCFVYVNRIFDQTFNPDTLEIVGQPVEALLTAGDRNSLRPFVEKVLEGEAQEFEYRSPAVDCAEQRVYRVSLVPNENDEDEGTACYVLMLDITEDKALQMELELKASLDPLTRVYNRKYLEDTLEKVLSDRRQRKPVYVALLDLDGFKQINDGAGHDAGDHVLREVAGTLREGLRKNDVLARYGGDEFVVLLHCVDERDLRDTCSKMLERINSHVFRHGEQEFRIGMSIGATRIDRGEAMHHLLVRADSAMYLAKRRGRNRIEIVSPDDSPMKIRNQLA